MVRIESNGLEAFKQSFSTIESLDSPRENMTRYKTELCKKWIQYGSCPYRQKCRFAHGKEEIKKYIPCKFYKSKDCKSFFTNGFCNYGHRCMFRHDERILYDIERTYYNLILNSRTYTRRLGIFQIISRNICQLN
jgi:hypothetical protein